MSRNINVFGKKIESDKLKFYIICFAVLSIYSFLEKPFVKSKYLRSDTEYFEDNYFLKIYLTLWVILIIFISIRINKTKEEFGGLILFALLFFFVFYVFLNNFITINTLYINQIKSVGKEKIEYVVFNYENQISIQTKNDKEYISELTDRKFFNQLKEKRKINHVQPLNQIKHGDTINVVYDKGLFGFKYLN